MTTADPAAGCQKCRFIRGGKCNSPSVVACNLENEGAGVVNAYQAYLAIKPVVTSCSADSDCDDNNNCTTDQCSETEQTCVNEKIPSCQVTELCWSGSNGYLAQNRNQAKKFCSCAQGSYGYSSYNSERSRMTVYRYTDIGDNENWEVSSSSARSGINQVKCLDKNWYTTNQDYYR